MLEDKVTHGTIIDAGHYAYMNSPNELDGFIWEEGVKIYAYAREQFANVGLMLCVDDMRGVKSNSQRRMFRIEELPPKYIEILKKYQVYTYKVVVVSQAQMSQKGRLRFRGLGQCERIAAQITLHKMALGYRTSINFYEDTKTAGGLDLEIGIQHAYAVQPIMVNHTIIFRDKEKFSYFKHPEQNL